MEKLLLVVGLCFLFLGFSGLFALGLDLKVTATVLLKISWLCLFVIFLAVVKTVVAA